MQTGSSKQTILNFESSNLIKPRSHKRNLSSFEIKPDVIKNKHFSKETSKTESKVSSSSINSYQKNDDDKVESTEKDLSATDENQDIDYNENTPEPIFNNLVLNNFSSIKALISDDEPLEEQENIQDEQSSKYTEDFIQENENNENSNNLASQQEPIIQANITSNNKIEQIDLSSDHKQLNIGADLNLSDLSNNQSKQLLSIDAKQNFTIDNNSKQLTVNNAKLEQGNINPKMEAVKDNIVKFIPGPQQYNNQPESINFDDNQVKLSAITHSNVVLASDVKDNNFPIKAINAKFDMEEANIENKKVTQTDSLNFVEDDPQNNEEFRDLQKRASNVEIIDSENIQFTPKNNSISNSSSNIINQKIDTQAPIKIEFTNISHVGKNELIINLFPEELGSITVKIVSVMGDDNIKKIQNIKITSPREETLELLKSNRIDLEKELSKVMDVEKESKLQFEMNNQNHQQNKSNFASTDDKNNWMKNFAQVNEFNSEVLDIQESNINSKNLITDNSVNIKV